MAAPSQTFRYVIEHMEEDDNQTRTVPPWVHLEYAHMVKLASPSAHIHFTSLSSASATSLPSILDATPSLQASSSSSSSKYTCTTDPILTLLASSNPPIPIHKVCLLDPKAERVLSPADGEPGVFEYFLFGGILGDDPPRDRTGELRKLGFETRHLGEVQMTTDTAVNVTMKVVEGKIPLDQIPYLNHPTITFSANESVEMPFRTSADLGYVQDAKGEPTLPDGMRELLKEDLNKSFEF